MDHLLTMLVTVFCSVIASSGFWAFMQKRAEKKDNRTMLLLGICHDRILYLGMMYIERGFMTRDEYINLIDYLSKPYFELGGNGAAHRIIEECKSLPIRDSVPKKYKPV